MTGLVPLLLLFSCGWLLACLWLLLMGQLLNQLSCNEPAAYAVLGKPVMRWLWWRGPASAPGSGSRLLLQAKGPHGFGDDVLRVRRWGRSQGLPSVLFSIARSSR